MMTNATTTLTLTAGNMGDTVPWQATGGLVDAMAGDGTRGTTRTFH